MRLIDADALYNGAMKDEYFNFVAHDNHGRESFAYSCAMQRLAEAPTIPAIPVEWLKEQAKDNYEYSGTLIRGLLSEWWKEQRDGNGKEA